MVLANLRPSQLLASPCLYYGAGDYLTFSHMQPLFCFVNSQESPLSTAEPPWTKSLEEVFACQELQVREPSRGGGPGRCPSSSPPYRERERDTERERERKRKRERESEKFNSTIEGYRDTKINHFPQSLSSRHSFVTSSLGPVLSQCHSAL